MKRTLISMLCLISMLMIICSPSPVYAQVENNGIRHYYLDIPADTVTPGIIKQALQNKYGKVNTGDYDDYLIEDLGYKFNLKINYYDESHVGAFRIFLGSVENGWGSGDEFKAIIIRDIEQFITMERELIAQYGEPTNRYFYTDTTKYNLSGSTHFMFSSRQWDIDQMLAVCENNQYLVAFTNWDNVTIRLWVDWKNEKKLGFLSKLDWYYLYEDTAEESQTNIVDYPIK